MLCGSITRIGTPAARKSANRLHRHIVVAQDLTTQPRAGLPRRPRAAKTAFSASVILSGSPLRNRTRQVVQRALPPHAWECAASLECTSIILACCAASMTKNRPCAPDATASKYRLEARVDPGRPHRLKLRLDRRWEESAPCDARRIRQSPWIINGFTQRRRGLGEGVAWYRNEARRFSLF